MNNPCCVLNVQFNCTFCGWKICAPCHTNSNPGFGHSHSVSLLGGTYHSAPFFCPAAQELLSGDVLPDLVASSKYDTHFKLVEQIAYLNSIKGKDAPRDLVQT